MSISIVGMVRSLNLSVAAAICLHEATRQRAATGRDYRLSAEGPGPACGRMARPCLAR